MSLLEHNGFKFKNILSKSAVEPLPEIGFIIASGTMFEGTPKNEQSGSISFANISNAPEAFSIETPTIKPINVGISEIVTLNPPSAPCKKVSNIGTFLYIPQVIISIKINGTT